MSAISSEEKNHPRRALLKLPSQPYVDLPRLEVFFNRLDFQVTPVSLRHN